MSHMSAPAFNRYMFATARPEEGLGEREPRLDVDRQVFMKRMDNLPTMDARTSRSTVPYDRRV
jgi:hypothetical protein